MAQEDKNCFRSPILKYVNQEAKKLPPQQGKTGSSLVTVYQYQLCSTLEFGASVFHRGFTTVQNRELELVQKNALSIILVNNYCTEAILPHLKPLARIPTPVITFP